jgi:3-(methylthio)propanoyl-CoA dehydrogenase
MIKMMQVKTKAIRSLLYETCRFVDMYKVYQSVSHERKLEPEERDESKKYQKLADVYTPLLKLFSSEYCNQIAYDALQVHGGAGFMKDFPVERIYRDARITTIYEGTSQLQVVAAIRGVTSGVYLNQIRQVYETERVSPEMEYLKKMLIDMTDDYETACNKVNEFNDTEYVDFHARRLVEMAGNIIMGYLLVTDSLRNDEYLQSAEIFTKRAFAQNKERFDYISKFEVKDLGVFKV